MEFKLIGKNNNDIKTISSLDDLEKEFKKHQFLYFSNQNSHKDMMDLVDELSNKGYSVYFREVKYGLNDDNYMYELHVL